MFNLRPYQQPAGHSYAGVEERHSSRLPHPSPNYCSAGTGDTDMAIVDALKEFLDSLDTGGRRTIDEQRAVRIFLAIATETGLPKAAVQRRLGVTWNKSFASASLAGDAAASSSSGLSELLAGPVRKTRCDQVPPLRTLSLPPWEAIPGAPMLCQARVL
mmetsp:Transcript_12939/g.28935  ORF Transcript_12939/g.28935 Transcript_12939/m.28935 type:complete len:159 (-) Transcript_12939:1545-2021(-)